MAEPAAPPNATEQEPHLSAASARTVRPRVLDAPSAQMMIFDRRVATTSSSTGSTSAASVEDPAVADRPVGVLPRDRERAARVPWSDDMGEELPESMRKVGELPAAGPTRKATASPQGPSERTVARHIARLRERYDAETLFQLGRLMREGAR
ncbi:hypothetical protein ACFV6F_19685 [Kitasatospora phosalacinea]|uniref:hypothetical protein n=1 Tax=Kitasatospora phosalacinea TaxID=2065 RepID=UPI003650CF22